MAWQNYGWAWNVVGVQGSEYVILLLMANEADSSGKIRHLRILRIMQRCNISRRSVFVYLKRLEQKGFIKRTSQWRFDGSQYYSSFQVDLKRWFPEGLYNASLDMWKNIYKSLQDFSADRIEPCDVRQLGRVHEAWFQRNNKTLWLVTDCDVYEELLRKNIACFKEAAVLLRLSVRRFEAFRRPYFRD